MDSHSTIHAPHTATNLKVSDFNNSEWDRGAIVEINRYYSGETAPSSRHAEAKVLWSDTALHLRYICNQDEPLVVADNFQTEANTMGLWDRDVCEIFIAPNPNVVENYFEFEAAPTGEWLDVAIRWTEDQRQSDWEFKSNMRAAGRIEKERVMVGMQIPWSELIRQPKSGERWRVNLFRCVGKGPDRGYLAWEPTLAPKPNFHVPDAFGWLVFV